jgi:hypothetical protein
MFTASILRVIPGGHYPELALKVSAGRMQLKKRDGAGLQACGDVAEDVGFSRCGKGFTGEGMVKYHLG